MVGRLGIRRASGLRAEGRPPRSHADNCSLRPAWRCCTSRLGAPTASATAERRARPTPGDALAIADVVRRKRGELSPALEPELGRALAMLELHPRRSVRDRTQAIPRLRSDWPNKTPLAKQEPCAATASAHCASSSASASATDSPTSSPRAASASWRATSRTSTTAPRRSTERLPSCSTSTTTRSPTCKAPAPTSLPPSSPRLATFAASATPPPSRASAAPHRSPVAQAKPPAATAVTARQPTTQRRALPHRHRPTTTPPRRESLPRPIRFTALRRNRPK
jgi:hypothetical protein